MCDMDKYQDNLERLLDYFEYVNAKFLDEMLWEEEMYAAYATAFGLDIYSISQWFSECEDNWIPFVDDYLADKYEVWKESDLAYYYEKEVHREGILRECAGYWFVRV